MFIDEFTHAVDGKGRVSVPSDMRDALRAAYAQELLLVTRSPSEKCLMAFPLEEWTRLLRKLAHKGVNPRAVSAAAKRSPVDKAGRILLTDVQRAYTGIGKEAVFVGAGRHIEIWEPGAWAEASGQAVGDETARAFGEAVTLLGLED